MKKYIKLALLNTSMVFFVFSCQFFGRKAEPQISQRTRGAESILLDYLNFAHQSSEADGLLKLYSSVGFPGQNFPTRIADFTGFFKDKNYNFVPFVDSMRVENLNIPIEEPNLFELRNSAALSNLYGKNVNFSLIKGSQKIENSLYIPKLLHIQTDTLPDNSTIASIGVGTRLSWNIDDKNTKGLVIILRYSPEMSFGNVAQQYPNSIEKFVGVEDNQGSYIFTEKDIEGLPKGKDAHIDLIVGRMGFGLYNMASHNKIMAIYGYNIVSAKAQLK